MGSIPTVEAIYREHHAFVWRVIRRFGVPEAAVEDAVQEVFVVLHRRRSELRWGAAGRGLLFGIARRVAPRFRARNPPAPMMDDTVAPVRSDPERRIDAVEKAEVIREALDALNEGKRLTFLLVAVEGMTVPEAAACQDIIPRMPVCARPNSGSARRSSGIECAKGETMTSAHDDDDALFADYVRAFATEQTPSDEDAARVWASVQQRTRARRARQWAVVALASLAAVGLWMTIPGLELFHRDAGVPTSQAPYDAPSRAPVEGVLHRNAIQQAPHRFAPNVDKPAERVVPDPARAETPEHAATRLPPRPMKNRRSARNALPDAPAPASKPDSAAPPPPTAVAQETMLYRKIQQSLQRGEPAATLALCREHERRFPGGLFRTEREVVTALTLCELGRRTEALAQAKAFMSAHPRSHLKATMQSICPPRPTVTDSGSSPHDVSGAP